ncbi:hypothetical protein GCM10011521_20240 [Arenimonas soli]|uniref:THIF-type NAD/FAD binding fold domain-containing protein n=1 Tax=Arenimonas soli TaxID=2269504 RepID=A0ABQ1HLZ8_9GAMM|nr:ThiF family adenylyltransferase [Arenimonas soli]GGA81853.1 hypothetical protein GCM10011521_20240 [Arenimonas soli]
MGLTPKLDKPDAIDATVVRNVDVISPVEQAALRAGRLLVAGCGSVGGSIVEPLVRMGLGAVVLADPEDFDLSNINRQACLLADVGRSKAEVLDERARAINPHLDSHVLVDGLTDENIEEAFTGVNLVFDAVDAATSPWAKYRLHEIACERRIPVMAGFDFGGKAVVYVFDYRLRSTTPFYGRATAQAHREGRLADCLKWLGYRHYPADFLPIIQDRLISRKPWPQVAYCVQAMGALGTRAAVELLAHRRVPHVLSFDAHMAMRGPWARIREVSRIPLRLLGALAASRRAPSAAVAPEAELDPLQKRLASDPVLKRVLEAMVTAPSPHNCQPWQFHLLPGRSIRIGWNRARGLPAVDPQAWAIAYSLGCALEAAATIADVDFEPAPPGNETDPDYFAGTLHVRGFRAADYARGLGLLHERSTHRHAFLDVPLPANVAARCDELAAPLRARAVCARPEPDLLHSLGFDGALTLFRQPAYVRELFEHLRLSDAQELATPTGFSADSLVLDPFSLRALSLLRAFPRLHRWADRFGLARLMAHWSTAILRKRANYVVVSTDDWTSSGRVNVGRALMRVWLELGRSHFVCQPVDFPISSEAGRARIREIFGLDPSQRPVVLLRVGRARRRHLRRSPRLPLAAFCIVEPTAEATATPLPATAVEA